MILKDLQSIENAIELLNRFSLCSRPKINIEKTKVKSLGNTITADHYLHGLSWIKTPLETLKIYITNNPTENLNYNFKPKLTKLRNLLNIWKQRTLTIKEKITIVNSLALSPLIYISIMIETPPEALKEIKDIIQNFIWERKTTKISQKTLINNIDNEGLKLSYFPFKVDSIKLCFVKRLCGDTDVNWTFLPKLFYDV